MDDDRTFTLWCEQYQKNQIYRPNLEYLWTNIEVYCIPAILYDSLPKPHTEPFDINI